MAPADAWLRHGIALAQPSAGATQVQGHDPVCYFVFSAVLPVCGRSHTWRPELIPQADTPPCKRNSAPVLQCTVCCRPRHVQSSYHICVGQQATVGSPWAAQVRDIPCQARRVRPPVYLDNPPSPWQLPPPSLLLLLLLPPVRRLRLPPFYLDPPTNHVGATAPAPAAAAATACPPPRPPPAAARGAPPPPPSPPAAWHRWSWSAARGAPRPGSGPVGTRRQRGAGVGTQIVISRSAGQRGALPGQGAGLGQEGGSGVGPGRARCSLCIPRQTVMKGNRVHGSHGVYAPLLKFRRPLAIGFSPLSQLLQS